MARSERSSADRIGMQVTFPRFAIFLALVLAVWFWPSIFGGKVLLPADLLWQTPPYTPPPGVEGLHNPLIGDMLYENYAWKVLQRRCIAGSEWPLWNPYTFCGHPLYATGQASTFYPLNLVFILAPLPQAFVIYTLIHLWLAGVFQYLFLRRIGVGPFGAAIGGVAFALCGFLAMRLIWPMLLGSAVWLPLMLLWIIRLSESSGTGQAARRAALGSVIFALPVLSGFFEIAFYCWFVAGLFTLACGWHVWRRNRCIWPGARLCISALAMVVLAVLLTGPQLLPFLEVKDMTTRAGEANYDRVVSRALRAEHLLEMVIPDIFGNPARHEAFDLRTRSMQPIKARYNADFYAFGDKNYSENGYYLGLLPLGLAIIGVFVSGRHRWFLTGLLVLSLLLAFGTRAYALLYYTIPGFEQVRTPFRWMFPATFAICCLAAIGAQWWHRRLTGKTAEEPGAMPGWCGNPSSHPRETCRDRNLDTADTPGAMPTASGDSGAMPTASLGAMPTALRGHADVHAQRVSRLSRAVGIAIIAVPAVLLLVLLVMLILPSPAHRLADCALQNLPRLAHANGFLNAWDVAGFMWANALRFTLLALAAAVVIALPLLRAWGPAATAVAGLSCLVLTAVDPLQANGPFMTQADPAWLDRVPPAVEFIRSDSGLFRIGRFGSRTVLHPNLPMLYGLYDTGGYDSVILDRYARYLDAIEPQRAIWFNQIIGFQDPDSLDSPLLRLLNIRYLLADSRTTINHPDWELVFKESINIYRTRREHPRAFMVHRIEPVATFEEAVERLGDGKVDTARTAVVEEPPAGLAASLPGNPAEPGRVHVTRYTHTSVEMKIASAAAGLVVLCDVMYPGWRAYVDGRPADILTVDGIFRGVPVAAGQHTLTFRFEPTSLRNGVVLLCFGLLGAGGCVAASWLPARQRQTQ